MAKKQSVITIDADTISSATPSSPHKAINQRLGNLESLTSAVLWLGLIALFGIFVSVATLVVDQEHFNNETYREQSSDLQAQIELATSQLLDITNQSHYT